jgi:hypothetical protein
LDSILERRKTVERLQRRWMAGVVEDNEEGGDPKVVDGRQGLRTVAKVLQGAKAHSGL